MKNKWGGEDTSKVNPFGKEFYIEFKRSFLNDDPIKLTYNEDGEWVSKYIELLYMDLQKEYEKDKDFETFKARYELFKKSYSVHLRWGVYDFFVDVLIWEKRYKEALVEWVKLREEEWGGWNMDFTYRDSEIFTLMKFENLMNKSLINGYFIEKIAPKGNQLTKFGKRNRSEVFKHIDVIIRETCNDSFFSQFYRNYSFEKNKNLQTHPFTYYEKYFLHNKNAKKTWAYYTTEEQLNLANLPVQTHLNPHVLKSGLASKPFVMLALTMEASRLLREAENSYREAIGSKKIGEAWISETELFYKVKTHFKEYEVIQHGRPEWLGRQHLDVWIPELKIAIEYHGEQHDKPIEFFGGQKAFEQNQKRDKRKKTKCIENGIKLIEVREGYNLEMLIEEINRGFKIS